MTFAMRACILCCSQSFGGRDLCDPVGEREQGADGSPFFNRPFISEVVRRHVSCAPVDTQSHRNRSHTGLTLKDNKCEHGHTKPTHKTDSVVLIF